MNTRRAEKGRLRRRARLSASSLFSLPSPRFAASAAPWWAFPERRRSSGSKRRPLRAPSAPSSARERRATREHPYQYRRWKCHRHRCGACARPLAAWFGTVTVVRVRAWATFFFSARSGRTAHFLSTDTHTYTEAHARTHAHSTHGFTRVHKCVSHGPTKKDLRMRETDSVDKYVSAAPSSVVDLEM